MKIKLALSSLKLQTCVAVTLLLLQVNLYADGQQSVTTAAPILGLEETNSTESQDISKSPQPENSHPQQLLLKGIVLTAVIVVSILGGLTCLIMCTIVTVAISVKVHKQRKQNRSGRPTSTTNTVAVNVQSFDMTNNTAYYSGQQVEQVRTNNRNVYSPQPSSRATGAQNSEHMHSELEAPVIPRRYLQTPPNNRVDISVDSLGYVRLPRPHN